MKNKKDNQATQTPDLANFFYADAWGIMDEVFPDTTHGHVRNARGSEELAILAEITNGTKVLDIGSGIAGLGVYLAKNYNCRVTCVDLAEDMIKKAMKLAKLQGVYDYMTFHTADIGNFNLGYEQFDYIFSMDALVQIGNRLALFEKCHRALTSKGTLAFTDYILEFPSNDKDINKYLQLIASPGKETLQSYTELLTRAGFCVTCKKSKKKEAVKWIGQLVHRLKKRELDFIEKYGNEEYEAILAAFSGWLSFAQAGMFNYCQIVAKKTS